MIYCLKNIHSHNIKFIFEVHDSHFKIIINAQNGFVRSRTTLDEKITLKCLCMYYVPTFCNYTWQMHFEVLKFFLFFLIYVLLKYTQTQVQQQNEPRIDKIFSKHHKSTDALQIHISTQMHTNTQMRGGIIHFKSQSSKYYQDSLFELFHMLSKSIQLSFVLRMCFLFSIKIEMYFYMPNTQWKNVQWQHSVWGMR